MDLQFYGANCIAVTFKGSRIVIDDNLAELGSKSLVKADDVALFTSGYHNIVNSRLMLDGPGEYEVSDISVIGIPARAHMDKEGLKATIFKLIAGDQSVLLTGHIYPELDDKQLEAIGMVDVMVVPVGGNGYTLDPIGALKLIKQVEPKIAIPTHYADQSLNYPVPQQELSQALKEMAMEPKETLSKLRLKPAELTDVTQLIILNKS